MTGSLKPELGNLKPEACPRPRTGVRKILLFLFSISVFWLLISAPAAQAACSAPAGNAGHIINNADYHVLQYCDGTNWKPMGPTGAGGTGCGNVSTGLVGWWKLDDGAGTSAVDSSGNSNTGTTQNSPVWNTGKINGALTFVAASNQYVDAGDAASLRISGSWTVSTWVKLTSLPASGNYMVLVSKDNTNFSSNYVIMVDNGAISAGLGWLVDYNSTSCCDDRFAKYTTSISTGTWYHVAGVYDSVAHTETLYLNGVSVVSFNATGLTPESGGGKILYLGLAQK